MNTKTHPLIIAISLLFFMTTACKQEKKANNEVENTITQEEEKEEVETIAEITLEKLTGSPAYEDAALVLDTKEEIKVPQSGEHEFSFEVKNYELGAQTNGPNPQKLANSGKAYIIWWLF